MDEAKPLESRMRLKIRSAFLPLAIVCGLILGCSSAPGPESGQESAYSKTVITGMPSAIVFDLTQAWVSEALSKSRKAIRRVDRKTGKISVEGLLSYTKRIDGKIYSPELDTMINIEVREAQTSFSFRAVNMQLTTDTYAAWVGRLDSLVEDYRAYVASRAGE
jgi:hypothetical protein